jgi:hypothetical protein
MSSIRNIAFCYSFSFFCPSFFFPDSTLPLFSSSPSSSLSLLFLFYLPLFLFFSPPLPLFLSLPPSLCPLSQLFSFHFFYSPTAFDLFISKTCSYARYACYVIYSVSVLFCLLICKHKHMCVFVCLSIPPPPSSHFIFMI